MNPESQPVSAPPPAALGRYVDPKLPEFLRSFEIDLVLDVGANTGQFAQELFTAGFRGRIVSFEPLAKAHAQLVRAGAENPRWTVAPRCALGAARGEQTLHIAGNLESSSLLEILPAHVRAARRSGYVDAETVSVYTLDEIATDYLAAATAPFLKIDVQGFEEQVLQGAAAILPKVKGLQAEMSLVPLYKGEPLFEPLLARIRSLGFELWWLRPGFTDPKTGRALQLDAIFFRPPDSEQRTPEA